MKKKWLFLLAVAMILSAPTVFADPITSPEMKTTSSSPGYNDTFYTYYSTLTGFKSGGKWGFYNSSKTVYIPPVYTDIEAMNSEYIKVKMNGAWGVIDKYGEFVLPEEYQDITTLSGLSNCFKVEQGYSYGVVDRYNNVIVPVAYQNVSVLNSSYIKLVQNSMAGVYSITEGRNIIEPQYDDIRVLGSYFTQKQNGQWGVIDRTNKVYVPAEYDDVEILNNKYFKVKSNKVWGTVDLNGQKIIAPKYDKIELGKAQYLKVKLSGKWGVVTFDGTLVAPIVNGPFQINKVVNGLN